MASQRGHSKGSLGSILASVSCCLSVQVSRMIYDFGKQVEIPCQYYRSLSGSISLRGASSWLSHWLLLWLIEMWMPRDESQMNQSIKFFDTYLQCSEPSATNIQLMPDHHYSHLAQGRRSRWMMSDLTAVENLTQYYAIPQKLLPWPAEWVQRSTLSHHSNSDAGCRLCFVLLALH